MSEPIETRGGLREHLKTATAQAHQHAEEALQRNGCFDHADGFRLYLDAMTACHRRFRDAESIVAQEAHLGALTDELLESLALDRSRLGSLEDDTLPPPEAISADEAWGIQYALEGSSMGARLLAPRSASLFPDSAPSRYLQALASAGPQRWRTFVSALEKSGGDADAALTGALKVFTTVAEHVAKAASDLRDPSRSGSG